MTAPDHAPYRSEIPLASKGASILLLWSLPWVGERIDGSVAFVARRRLPYRQDPYREPSVRAKSAKEIARGLRLWRD